MRLAPLYQQDRELARQEGLEQGVQQGEQQLILRLLNRRFGEIELSLIEQIQGLSIAQLETLAEALLDFATVADLEAWLRGCLKSPLVGSKTFQIPLNPP